MQVDLYTATGTKKGSLELPASMFEVDVNRGLMHLALIRQQSNRRTPVAHARHRGEMVGSTRKLYQQKHTGQARRGASRSPLLKGGGKSFGPRNEANFVKDMPKKMRRAALFSCLSSKAKAGAIIGLENYPEDPKTKNFFALLKKLPLDIGRKIVLVVPAAHKHLEMAARNVPGVKTLYVQYLNPEDILGANKIVFVSDAVTVAEKLFASGVDRSSKKIVEKEAKKEAEAKTPKVVNPATSLGAGEPKAKKAPAKPKVANPSTALRAGKPVSKKKA